MSFRTYLNRLDTSGELLRLKKSCSKDLTIAGVLSQASPSPIFIESVSGNQFTVAGNLFCSKEMFARYFGIKPCEIIPFISKAISSPSPCQEITSAPCQEVIETGIDLDSLPILFHCSGDGGPYISSGVFITSHPKFGQNLDFHRAMQFSKDKMAIRVVQSRHFDRYLQEQRTLDVAICIGNSPNVLAAAATSVAIGVNELEIANSMEPVPVVKAITSNLLVPAECEFVIEGTVSVDERHSEGPFIDLTETYDIIRQEPVFTVKAITHRRDAIWHALLPGGLEHKLLMGMPREPTIFQKVNEVVRCLDVSINPGGCSWLHTVIQIEKHHEEDGKKAILAAFAGHSSCKHVFVVDHDIDIYDPLQVEWAMATRFQADRDLVILPRSPGSSLDPSADAGTHMTTRAGFDLTAPLETAGKSFSKAAFPQVDLKNLLGDPR
ncbi:MAG TPA: UbiD family decarboxylase [Anaerolineaceae bacterium]